MSLLFALSQWNENSLACFCTAVPCVLEDFILFFLRLLRRTPIPSNYSHGIQDHFYCWPLQYLCLVETWSPSWPYSRLLHHWFRKITEVFTASPFKNLMLLPQNQPFSIFMLCTLPQNWKAKSKIAGTVNYITRLQWQKAMWHSCCTSSLSSFIFMKIKCNPQIKHPSPQWKIRQC